MAFLFTARPTAVNLGAATRRLTQTLNTSIAAGKRAPEIAHDLILEGNLIADEDVGRNKKMAKWGGDWLIERVGDGSALNVLTVCNTGSLATSVGRQHNFCTSVLLTVFSQGYGTALGLITYLHETDKLNKAYYTQTAPYHQGSR